MNMFTIIVNCRYNENKTNLSPSVHLDPEDQEHQVSLGDPKVENSKYTNNDDSH